MKSEIIKVLHFLRLRHLRGVRQNLTPRTVEELSANFHLGGVPPACQRLTAQPLAGRSGHLRGGFWGKCKTLQIKFLLVILVIALASFLRFFKLGQIPPSLDWDEASLGYNAYTILKTGNDEYGNKLPLSIRSFNDYKASVYVYFSTIPLAIFGLNEFSIRFVAALFGSLTVLLTFFLVKEICNLDGRFRGKGNILAILTTLFLAISPWHLQFSRVAFEANLAPFFFVLGTLLLLLALRDNLFLPLAALVFGISLFTYHSCRLIVPVFVLGIIAIYGKKIFRQKSSFLIASLITFMFTVLLLYSFKVGGLARFTTTSIFRQDKNLEIIIKEVIKGYLLHYDFNFLFIKGDHQPRHHGLGVAQLYLWELPFVIAGIVSLIKNKFKGNQLIFLWFLTAPLASSLTQDVPNAVRSLLFLPTFQFFTAFGAFSLYQSIKRETFKALFVILIFAFLILNFFYYLHMYYIHGPWETSQDWLYGYKQLVEFVNERKDQYSKIIVTTTYDQPYVYFLFYQKPLKILVNNGEFYKGFEGIEFRPINWNEDQKLRNVLIAGTAEEIPVNEKILREIKFLDGQVAFRIARL